MNKLKSHIASEKTTLKNLIRRKILKKIQKEMNSKKSY